MTKAWRQNAIGFLPAGIPDSGKNKVPRHSVIFLSQLGVLLLALQSGKGTIEAEEQQNGIRRVEKDV